MTCPPKNHSSFCPDFYANKILQCVINILEILLMLIKTFKAIKIEYVKQKNKLLQF